MDKIIVEYQLKTEELRKELGDVKKGLSDTEKQVETSGSKMSKTFMNVGKAIAAAFSVQMLIQFTKKSVELYNIQAKAEASLLQALKGREDIQKRLMLQASELQKVTLFGDEATIQAQAMLAKFGMTETQIKRLIPLIQDYATISGQDLSSAADMVARSVATSTNALVRYGIEIEGAAGSSERMESAVESLSNMVGGQAVAAAEAGTGAIQQYQNAWGDFSEKVGEVFVPAITALLNVGSKLIDVLKMSVLGVQGYTDSIIEEFTSQEYIFNESQKKFEEWLKTNRDGYSNLTEAGAAYVAQLEAEMRQVNRALADGDYTEERARNARRRINIEIEAIQTYVDEMTRTISVTNDLGDANDKLADKFKVNKKDLEAFINELRDLNSVSAGALELTGLNIDRVADAILNMEETLQRIKDTNSEYVDTTQEAADWTGAWFDISRSVFQGLNALSDQQTQKYINNLQAQLDAGQITQEQFEKQRTEALRKQAKQDKQYSIFRIILDTASAVINFLTAKPPNVPASVAAGVAGAIQLGVAVNAPVPAFAEGVVGLNGDGTETSDSILARLSKGESVITAKGTRQDRGLFEAANKMKLEEYINKNYVLPVLLKKQQDDKAMFDDYRLYRSLQDLRHSDKANTRMIVNAIKTEKVNSRRYWA
jgi:hypothetical protein